MVRERSFGGTGHRTKIRVAYFQGLAKDLTMAMVVISKIYINRKCYAFSVKDKYTYTPKFH